MISNTKSVSNTISIANFFKNSSNTEDIQNEVYQKKRMSNTKPQSQKLEQQIPDSGQYNSSSSRKGSVISIIKRLNIQNAPEQLAATNDFYFALSHLQPTTNKHKFKSVQTSEHKKRNQSANYNKKTIYNQQQDNILSTDVCPAIKVDRMFDDANILLIQSEKIKGDSSTLDISNIKPDSNQYINDMSNDSIDNIKKLFTEVGNNISDIVQQQPQIVSYEQNQLQKDQSVPSHQLKRIQQLTAVQRPQTGGQNINNNQRAFNLKDFKFQVDTEFLQEQFQRPQTSVNKRKLISASKLANNQELINKDKQFFQLNKINLQVFNSNNNNIGVNMEQIPVLQGKKINIFQPGRIINNGFKPSRPISRYGNQQYIQQHQQINRSRPGTSHHQKTIQNLALIGSSSNQRVNKLRHFF